MYTCFPLFKTSLAPLILAGCWLLTSFFSSCYGKYNVPPFISPSRPCFKWTLWSYLKILKGLHELFMVWEFHILLKNTLTVVDPYSTYHADLPVWTWGIEFMYHKKNCSGDMSFTNSVKLSYTTKAVLFCNFTLVLTNWNHPIQKNSTLQLQWNF